MKDKGSISITLPGDVKSIIDKLEEAGFEAYAVGGCIRDSLLGREPEDWDITTSARPDEVKQIFKRTVDTGIKHGTVTVLLKHRLSEFNPDKYELRPYEVTTYRVDGEYRDGRHPESVSFSSLLTEDLRRRDFTVNALAYNDSFGLVDEFDGLSDMDGRCIRCVGDPDERFTEDALRILRAVRFEAQLGFEIEEHTANAITGHADKLSLVSKERIQAELSKLLCSAHPEMISELWRLSMAERICTGFEKLEPGVFRELLDTAEESPVFEELSPKLKYLRYAILLSETERQDAERILKELKLDNETIRRTLFLISELFIPIKNDGYAIKRRMQPVDRELFSELLELKALFSHTKRYKELCADEDITVVRSMFDKIIRRDEPVYLKDLIVKGSDLIKAGMEPGVDVGRILGEMHDDVLRHPEHNSILFLFSRYLYKG